MKRLSAALFVIVLMLCGQVGRARAAEQQQDAQALALLQKHHDFMGWQLGDGTFKTLRLTREYKNEKGEIVTRREELRVNLAYRNTSKNLQRNVTFNDGFTGNVFWNTNWNGFTTPEYGDAAKFHLTYAAFFNEGLNALPAALRGSATVDGTDARIVRVSLPQADDVDLYIDPASGACVRAVIDPGGDYDTTIRGIEYAEVLPGKKMIHSFRYEKGGPWVYTKVEPNAIVGDEELHPPAPSATWSFANARPFPFKVSYNASSASISSPARS